MTFFPLFFSYINNTKSIELWVHSFFWDFSVLFTKLSADNLLVAFFKNVFLYLINSITNWNPPFLKFYCDFYVIFYCWMETLYILIINKQ